MFSLCVPQRRQRHGWTCLTGRWSPSPVLRLMLMYLNPSTVNNKSHCFKLTCTSHKLCAVSEVRNLNIWHTRSLSLFSTVSWAPKSHVFKPHWKTHINVKFLFLHDVISRHLVVLCNKSMNSEKRKKKKRKKSTKTTMKKRRQKLSILWYRDFIPFYLVAC